jgi:hypothetical protein
LKDLRSKSNEKLRAGSRARRYTWPGRKFYAVEELLTCPINSIRSRPRRLPYALPYARDRVLYTSAINSLALPIDQLLNIDQLLDIDQLLPTHPIRFTIQLAKVTPRIGVKHTQRDKTLGSRSL